MNPVLLRLAIIVLGLVLIILLTRRFVSEKLIRKIYGGTNWLINKSYLFFVDIVIFLKPLKKHREKVGLYIWLFFVVLIGRYLVIQQPLTTEILPAYIPFIAYIYFLTICYLVKIIFELTGVMQGDDEITIMNKKEEK